MDSELISDIDLQFPYSIATA